MLELLRQVDADQLEKIRCIDEDANNIPQGQVEDRPYLCFIDGEHTNSAVFSDFRIWLSVRKENTIIVFHDATIIHKGISRCVAEL